MKYWIASFVLGFSFFINNAFAHNKAFYEAMVNHLTSQFAEFEKELFNQFEHQQNVLESSDTSAAQSLESEKLGTKKAEILERIRLIELALVDLEAKHDQLRMLREQYEAAKTEYPNRVAELNRENRELAKQIETEMFAFLAKIEESQKIVAEHNAFVDNIQDGSNSTIKEIEKLLREFDAGAHQLIQELQSKISAFNSEARQFNAKNVIDSNDLRVFQDSAMKSFERYRSAGASVNQSVSDYNQKKQVSSAYAQQMLSNLENLFSASAQRTFNNLQGRTDQAQQTLAALKTQFDLRKKDFEKEKQRYLQEEARIDAERKEKLGKIEKKKTALESHKKQLTNDLESQKVLVDQQIKLLDQELSRTVAELKSRFDKIKEVLSSQFGPKYEDFYKIYLKWTSRKATETETANQLTQVCGPNFGTNGGKVVHCIARMGTLKDLFRDLKQRLNERKEQLALLEADLTSSPDHQQEIATLQLLKSELNNIDQKFKSTSEAHSASRSQSSSEVEVLKNIFKLRLKILKHEFTILSLIIMSESLESDNLKLEICKFKEGCNELLSVGSKGGGAKQGSDLTHMRKNLFSDLCVLAGREETHEVLKCGYSSQQKIIAKVELREIEKKHFIHKWYNLLVKERALFDCEKLAEIYDKDVRDPQLEVFRKSLFQNTFYNLSQVYQIKFEDGTGGYQIVLNNINYLLNDRGDLQGSSNFKEGAKRSRKFFICPDPEEYKGQYFGNHHCVAFVQEVAGAPKQASLIWRPGPKVRGNFEIEKGTAIATFDGNGIYPDNKKGQHAAIYMGQNESGLIVYDQYVSKPVGESFIKFYRPQKQTPFVKETELINMSVDGDYYYVIITE